MAAIHPAYRRGDERAMAGGAMVQGPGMGMMPGMGQWPGMGMRPGMGHGMGMDMMGMARPTPQVPAHPIYPAGTPQNDPAAWNKFPLEERLRRQRAQQTLVSPLPTKAAPQVGEYIPTQVFSIHMSQQGDFLPKSMAPPSTIGPSPSMATYTQGMIMPSHVASQKVSSGSAGLQYAGQQSIQGRPLGSPLSRWPRITHFGLASTIQAGPRRRSMVEPSHSSHRPQRGVTFQIPGETSNLSSTQHSHSPSGGKSAYGPRNAGSSRASTERPLLESPDNTHSGLGWARTIGGEAMSETDAGSAEPGRKLSRSIFG